MYLHILTIRYSLLTHLYCLISDNYLLIKRLDPFEHWSQILRSRSDELVDTIEWMT